MRALVLFCCLAGACASPSPKPAPEFPPSLDFGPVVVGGERVLEIPTTRVGVTEAEFSVSEPFFLLPPAPLHPSAPPRVAFRPRKVGDASGTLAWLLGPARIQLTGSGRLAADCHPAACRKQVDAPDRLSCTLENLADGTACHDGCVRQGTCAAGECVGTFDPCDDHSVCTDDTCDRAKGCRHTPITCPASGNACVRTTCNGTTGCGFENQVDGSLCGSAKEDVVHRCRALTCVEEPVWKAETPCESDTPPLLAPAWRLDFGRAEIRGTAVDAAGRLAVVTCEAGACELLSLTRDGRIRVRAPTAPTTFRDQRLLAVHDLVVVTGETEVRAHDAATLDVRWSFSVAPDFAPNSHGLAGSLARVSGSTLAVVAYDAGDDAAPATDAVGGHLLYLDTDSGVLLARDLQANLEGNLASNGDGVLYSGAGNSVEAVKRRTNGVLTWWSVLRDAIVREVSVGDEVIIGGGRALDPESGAIRYLIPYADDPFVMSDGLAFASARNPVLSSPNDDVVVFRTADGVPLAACTVAPYTATSLFATSRRSALAVFHTSGRVPSTLREIDEHGIVTSIGTLENSIEYRDANVLEDLLIGVENTGTGADPQYHLVAYPLPAGLGLAPHGWVMDGGNPSRDFTPR